MRFWKPLSKYRYTDDRDEVKYHTDFELEAQEEVEIRLCGKVIIKEKVPVGEVRRYHLELASERFENGK